MMMKKFYIVAITAGLLLAVSGPGVAAKRTPSTKGAVKSQSQATPPQGSTTRSFGRDSTLYGRDNSDPYAYGVNWPKPF
jgi:hypothetical protein